MNPVLCLRIVTFISYIMSEFYAYIFVDLVESYGNYRYYYYDYADSAI